MKPKLYLLFILSIFYSTVVLSQNFTADKLLRLELHPTDDSKFIAKFYDVESGKIIEYWTMISAVSKINSENFNELREEKKIIADGKHYKFYPNSKCEFEMEFKDGNPMGEIIGYYDTGEVQYKGNYDYSLTGELVYLFKSGNIQKKENYLYGKLSGKTEAFYQSGAKQYVAHFENGKRDGKYQSYYQDGTTKRKANFERNNIISTKCFDYAGKRIDCKSFYLQPKFPGSTESLKTEIEKLDFSFNNNADTINFRVILELDSIGNPSLSSFRFYEKDSLRSLVAEWVKQLPDFTPPYVDGFVTPSTISLSFPVCKNEILWLGSAEVERGSITKSHGEGKELAWFLGFPNPADTTVYFIVPNMPLFPGGENELRNYISRSIQYPHLAQKKGIEGKVYVTFIVDIDGMPTNVRVMRSVHYLLDSEAIRVIKSMPKWKPGSLNGKPARVSYTVPINFILRKPLMPSHTTPRY